MDNVRGAFLAFLATVGFFGENISPLYKLNVGFGVLGEFFLDDLIDGDHEL